MSASFVANAPLLFHISPEGEGYKIPTIRLSISDLCENFSCKCRTDASVKNVCHVWQTHFSKFRETHCLLDRIQSANHINVYGMERLNESLTLLALRISENLMIQLDSPLAQLRTALAVCSPQIEFQMWYSIRLAYWEIKFTWKAPSRTGDKYPIGNSYQNSPGLANSILPQIVFNISGKFRQIN